MRTDLVAAFGRNTDPRAYVSYNSYLDLGSHWEVLLASLFRHNTCGARTECCLADFCVVSLFRGNENNGLVVGDVNAPRRLVVMNTGDAHFDPCLPLS